MIKHPIGTRTITVARASVYEGELLPETRFDYGFQDGFSTMCQATSQDPQQFRLVAIEATRMVYEFTLSECAAWDKVLKTGEQVKCREVKAELQGNVEQVRLMAELIVHLHALRPLVGVEKAREFISGFEPTNRSFLPGLTLVEVACRQKKESKSVQIAALSSILQTYDVQAEDISLISGYPRLETMYKIWHLCNQWIESAADARTFGQVIRDELIQPMQRQETESEENCI
jgi:hypothetical protein